MKLDLVLVDVKSWQEQHLITCEINYNHAYDIIDLTELLIMLSKWGYIMC